MCTVGVVLAGRYSDVMRNMREVAPGAPNWLVDFLTTRSPNFRNFDFKDRWPTAIPSRPGRPRSVTAYAAVYIAVALGLGLAAFRSRDFQ